MKQTAEDYRAAIKAILSRLQGIADEDLTKAERQIKAIASSAIESQVDKLARTGMLKTYPVTRDGKTINVTIPEKE